MVIFNLVPKEGLEPTLPKEHDFESCASTNSATSAWSAKIIQNNEFFVK